MKTKGFVDIAKNFYVPLEVLESTRELEEAINENVCVLLVGHFQSGKLSTLLFEKYQKELFLYTIIKVSNGILSWVM